MTQQDYYQAQVVLPKKKLLAKKEFSSQLVKLSHALTSYFETLITIKGHAWAMDVKSERKKMAKLVATGLMDLRT